MLRILAIGLYLRRQGSPYEVFVFRLRGSPGRNPFRFEWIALHASSIASAFLLIVAWYFLREDDILKRVAKCYLWAGVLGGVAIFLLAAHFKAQSDGLLEADKDLVGN